jgi:hypothetical protein
MAEQAGAGDDKGKSWPARALTAVAVLVPVIAGVIALLFTVDPRLAPCLGESEASFTGAPVFPHIGYRQFLVDDGVSGARAASEPNLPGAEIRYSYHTHGLRGHRLVLRSSLLSVERDGTLGRFAQGQNLDPDAEISPDACSETAGNTLFVEIRDPHQLYEVVLELYAGRGLTDRVALTQTAVFHG